MRQRMLGRLLGRHSTAGRRVPSLGSRFLHFPEEEPVEMQVLRPARTMVEKLVLLNTAHSAESPEAARRAARPPLLRHSPTPRRP